MKSSYAPKHYIEVDTQYTFCILGEVSQTSGKICWIFQVKNGSEKGIPCSQPRSVLPFYHSVVKDIRCQTKASHQAPIVCSQAVGNLTYIASDPK